MDLNPDAVAHRPPPRPVLLLVNLGTPSAPTAGAIRAYLREFLSDPRVVEIPRLLWWPILYLLVLPFRAPRLASKYAAIWTERGSPLLAHSRALAEAVQAQMPGTDVRLAMRYGEPSLGTQLREALARGAQRIAVLPLYPQYSASTTATVHDVVGAELAHRRQPASSALTASCTEAVVEAEYCGYSGNTSTRAAPSASAARSVAAIAGSP